MKKEFAIGLGILIVIVIGVLVYISIPKITVCEGEGCGESGEEFEEPTFLEGCLDSCGQCEQNCYDQDKYDSARNELDESLCNGIKSEGIKSECIFSVTLIKAVQAKDDSLCENLEEENKETCLSAVEASLNAPEESLEE